jgi:folate-dependent phosphoribosylglycinamide formyltransferase PurN
MKAIFLTTDDPIYLPAFYERVLSGAPGRTRAVFVVAPLYRKQTTWAAALRYARTFGLLDTLRLTGRVLGTRLRGQSIAATCRRHGVPCEEIADVNAPEFLSRLRAMEPDVLVSVSCPQIFRRPLIELAPNGVLNIHGAILPQYRGVLPSFWMLANGERQAGVSIYFVNEQIDAGDRCGLTIFDITSDDTLDSFLRRSKRVAAELLLDVMAKVEAGTASRERLNLKEGSYYSWPDPPAVERFRAAGRRVW